MSHRDGDLAIGTLQTLKAGDDGPFEILLESRCNRIGLLSRQEPELKLPFVLNKSKSLCPGIIGNPEILSQTLTHIVGNYSKCPVSLKHHSSRKTASIRQPFLL